jgi:hypothetical protein
MATLACKALASLTLADSARQSVLLSNEPTRFERPEGGLMSRHDVLHAEEHPRPVGDFLQEPRLQVRGSRMALKGDCPKFQGRTHVSLYLLFAHEGLQLEAH